MHKTFRTARAAICIAVAFACRINGEDIPTTAQSRLSANGQLGVAPAGAGYSVLPPTPTVPLSGIVDNSVDEKTYYIGGGDAFRIFVVDLPSMNYSASVNQNCDLIIPTLGIIPLGKVTLSRAKELIAEYMHQKMKRPNEIRVVLERIKNATIYAFGSVSSPGTYSFYGITRLWDVLKTITNASFSDNNFRAVRRINKDSTDYFDLFTFLYKGDFSQNPYVYPGDQLYVFPALNRVFITGSGLRGWINGQIPILPDEAATDFLSHFFFNENADLEHILIQRTDDNVHYEQVVFNLKQNQVFYLKNNDIVTVPIKKDYPQICIASVTGEVTRPGAYSIMKNGSSVPALIALAGSYTSFADTGKVVILRRAKQAPPLLAAGNKSDGEASIRPEMGASFGMTITTRDFQVIRVKEHPGVTLESGDQILVPRTEHMVFVSGSVKYPGGYPYKPNQYKNYYIKCAGGYTERADKGNIAIITFYGDITQTKGVKAELDEGDLIIVPMSREYKLFNMVILPSFSIILASLGVFMGILATTKQ
jgi:protein involved in polysaccharide export with SLBB domain